MGKIVTFNILLLHMGLISLFSCSVDGKMKGRIGGSTEPPAIVNDFANSEILVNSTGVSDGATPLYLIVRLVNSDGGVVSNFTPTYEIKSGSGVISLPCTKSDKLGVAICALKATEPGNKTFAISNISPSVNLQKVVTFLPPPSTRIVAGISSSGSVQQNLSGYTVHSSVSGWNQGIFELNSGYKIFINQQGLMDSD